MSDKVEIPDEVVVKALDGYCTVPTYGTYRGQFDAMRAALEAALPLLPARAMPTLEEIEERLAQAMADSWMGDEVDCADVGSILAPAVEALLKGEES